ncbi:mannose-binding protein C-like [Eriocheir sinensis]|uniref:mannose-binding protein C-like n=1 Tax=Eriocheir sinensis TaxID=95602 RepID=UPI0021C94E38|nr:mannose-binding protein C-like [Eriocheir sinensis]
MMRVCAFTWVFMWAALVSGELYRKVASDVAPPAQFALLQTTSPSLAMCSAVCQGIPSCLGFSYSGVNTACAPLQGSMGNVILDSAETSGCNIYWKITDISRGFTRFGNKAYLYDASPLTFTEAHQTCRDRYASIALPLNLQESQNLQLVAPSVTKWILASDVATEGSWVNHDTGTVLVYRNFIPPNPDNYGSIEDCGTLTSDSAWNDVACNNKYSFVCEVPQDHCELGTWDIRCTFA